MHLPPPTTSKPINAVHNKLNGSIEDVPGLDYLSNNCMSKVRLEIRLAPAHTTLDIRKQFNFPVVVFYSFHFGQSGITGLRAQSRWPQLPMLRVFLPLDRY